MNNFYISLVIHLSLLMLFLIKYDINDDHIKKIEESSVKVYSVSMKDLKKDINIDDKKLLNYEEPKHEIPPSVLTKKDDVIVENVDYKEKKNVHKKNEQKKLVEDISSKLSKTLLDQKEKIVKAEKRKIEFEKFKALKKNSSYFKKIVDRNKNIKKEENKVLDISERMNQKLSNKIKSNIEEKEKEKEKEKELALIEMKKEKERIRKEKEKLKREEEEYNKYVNNKKMLEHNRKKKIYELSIRDRILSNWKKDFGENGWSCQINVRQNKKGRILSFSYGDFCKDDKLFKHSIKNAVYLSEPFPISDDPSIFEGNLKFTFVVE